VFQYNSQFKIHKQTVKLISSSVRDVANIYAIRNNFVCKQYNVLIILGHFNYWKWTKTKRIQTYELHAPPCNSSTPPHTNMELQKKLATHQPKWGWL